MKKIEKERHQIATTEVLDYDDYEWFKEWYLDNYPEEFEYQTFCNDWEDNNDGPIPSEDSDEYKQWCEEQYPAENSDKHWAFMYQECEDCWDNDMSNIRYEKRYDTPVAITGSLGLWFGHPDIIPVVCDNVYEAIRKCGGSADDVEVFFDDGIIEVQGHHHDGTNCFYIRALSKKGLEEVDKAEREWRDCNFKDYHFKRLPYLYA